MKFADGNFYPNVARFVRGELPKAARNLRVIRAVERFGQFASLADAKAAVGSGAKPILKVKDLDWGKYGNYPKAGDTIFLNKVIAEQYERLIDFGYQPYHGRPADWDRLLRRATKMLEAIVLHETVHWQDWKRDYLTSDRYARRGHDWGHEFEIRAYGRVLSTRDIDGWMGWRYFYKHGNRYVAMFEEKGPYSRKPPTSRPRTRMRLGR